MTKTALIVLMEFEKTNFFIIFTNTTNAEKVSVEMASTSSGCKITSNKPYGQHLISKKYATILTYEVSQHYFFWDTLRPFFNSIIYSIMNSCHRKPKPWQYHLSGSVGTLYILNFSKYQSIPEEQQPSSSHNNTWR